MKLTRLHVQNYRSLVDVDLELRDLAVVIGPNGAGKTSLLELFQFLHQGSQGELSGFLEEQGGFQAVLSRRKEAKSLKLSFEAIVGTERRSTQMYYDFLLASQGVGYEIIQERLGRKGESAIQRGKALYDQPGNVPSHNLRSTELELAQTSFASASKVFNLLRTGLTNIRYYGFLEVGPRGIIRLPQSLTPATRPGPNGENLFSALYNLRINYEEVYERIESLLRQAFPGYKRLEFPVVGAGQVTLAWADANADKPFYPNQLSEGTLRFLWLITVLLAPPTPSVILLDEPEVSLHPELLKLLAALLQDASAAGQIVVATHSSDLIRWLKPAEVLIADKEDGQTRFTWADSLNLDKWLAEYTLSELWLMGNLGGRP
jgi:predicted ATPase